MIVELNEFIQVLVSLDGSGSSYFGASPNSSGDHTPSSMSTLVAIPFNKRISHNFLLE